MNIKNLGKFITLEGGEGAGKTSQAKNICEYLRSKNIPSIITREIGGTEQAEKIRNLLLDSSLHNFSELMLIMAARYEHVNDLIIPSMLDGIWVICDRYIDSTLCYQSTVETSYKDIIFLHNQCIFPSHKLRDRIQGSHPNFNGFGLMPDITFFLDISPEIGLVRAKNRGITNKFEEKDLSFHCSVQDKFLQLLEIYPNRIKKICVDNLSEQDVFAKILSQLTF